MGIAAFSLFGCRSTIIEALGRFPAILEIHEAGEGARGIIFFLQHSRLFSNMAG